jgi:hypothetical protein
MVWHHGRAARDNPRCVITNLRQSPEWSYTHVYCARGDSENRLKELHHALAFGRTSCTRFLGESIARHHDGSAPTHTLPPSTS